MFRRVGVASTAEHIRIDDRLIRGGMTRRTQARDCTGVNQQDTKQDGCGQRLEMRPGIRRLDDLIHENAD